MEQHQQIRDAYLKTLILIGATLEMEPMLMIIQ